MIKLLVVDGYPLEGEMIEYILKKHRPEIRYVGQALSGQQALRIVEDSVPDIVTVDIQLPGMDGLNVVQTLTQNYPQIKIVIITAFDRLHYIQLVRRMGISEYFLKPVQTSEFLAMIDRLCHTIRQPQPNPAAGSYSGKLPIDYHALLERVRCGETDEALRVLEQIWSNLEDGYWEDASALRPLSIEIAAALLYTPERHTHCPDALYLCHRTFIDGMMTARSTEAIHRCLLCFISQTSDIFNQNSSDIGYRQVHRAKELIEEGLDNQASVSLAHIAHELYISPFYLSRLFKKKTGVNFMDHLTERRLEKAKLLLLTTDDTVDTIAQKTGYNESSSFRRLFKRKVGVSPSAYRKRQYVT